MAFDVKFNNGNIKMDIDFGMGSGRMDVDFNGTQTIKGDDGRSAYEIALANGFEGTEQEWLDSLPGKPGDDGVSPKVDVQTIDGGHRVSVTDAYGSKTFDVMDGEPGVNAENDELFIVRTFNADDGYIRSDRTVAEIIAAANDGKVVLFVDHNGRVFTYMGRQTYYYDGKKWPTFSETVSYESSKLEIRKIQIRNTNDIVDSGNPNVKTPVPYKLKFTGATNATFDGSAEVTVDIPNGGVDKEQLDQAVQEALQEAKDSGLFDGKDGKDGIDGKDGYTPVKGVDYFDGKDGKDGEDGYTPVKGKDYFDGQPGRPGADGTDGKDGADGFSPTVSVSKTGKTTTISLTDKDGTKTATINDGEDGKDGENAEGGSANQINGQYNTDGTVTFDMPFADMYALGAELAEYDIGVTYYGTRYRVYRVTENTGEVLLYCSAIDNYQEGIDLRKVYLWETEARLSNVTHLPLYNLPTPRGNVNMYLGTDDSGNYVLKDIPMAVLPMLNAIELEGTILFLSPDTGEPAIITMDMLSEMYGDNLANLKVTMLNMETQQASMYGFAFLNMSEDPDDPIYILFAGDNGKVIRMEADGTLSYVEEMQLATQQYVQSYIEQTILGGAW